MTITIKHSDKSGLQYFEPNSIFTMVEAWQYIKWMEKKFGVVPYKMIVDNVLVSQRKNHEQQSIIYV